MSRSCLWATVHLPHEHLALLIGEPLLLHCSWKANGSRLDTNGKYRTTFLRFWTYFSHLPFIKHTQGIIARSSQVFGPTPAPTCPPKRVCQLNIGCHGPGDMGFASSPIRRFPGAPGSEAGAFEWTLLWEVHLQRPPGSMAAATRDVYLLVGGARGVEQLLCLDLAQRATPNLPTNELFRVRVLKGVWSISCSCPPGLQFSTAKMIRFIPR